VGKKQYLTKEIENDFTLHNFNNININGISSALSHYSLGHVKIPLGAQGSKEQCFG
jgi:hypothetical protein